MQDLYSFTVRISSIVGILILFVAVAFKSIIWTFVVAGIFIIASIYAVRLARYFDDLLTKLNVQINGKFLKKYKDEDDSCSVCSNNTCKRHKLLAHSTRVKVPKDFDRALEQLLEQVLEIYICTWYSDFSANDAFMQQLRVAITTAAKNVTARLFRADTSVITFRDLIPLTIQHARNWNAIMKNAKLKDTTPQDYLKTCAGLNIHPAAYSRRAELNYLRGLVTALLPYLLPAIHVSQNNKVMLREILANWVLLPAIDALADPDNINGLVTLSTHRDACLSDATETVNVVPMLQSWVTATHTHVTYYNCFKPSLNEILNDPELLYMFMQHIKQSGPMNLLQFCLDIDDLSKRILNPEISVSAESSLYMDVKNMYMVYLDPNGPEYLYLPSHISKGIQHVLEGGPKQIQELRTSRPFYQAHQEAHALLEITCLPSFHHSYQLYKLLCGHLMSEQGKAANAAKQVYSATSGDAHNASKATSTPVRYGNQPASKIENVFRTCAIDGAPFPLQDVYPIEQVDCTVRVDMNEMRGFDERNRDLTTWRVAVPHVDSGGMQPVYMIAIHSAAEAKSWTVLRQDQDFYTLRTRLVEFHGDKELSDSPLPSRKNPYLPLAANRQRYEEFLQKLLSKSTLRSSELLYTFLTTANLKPYYANYGTPDIGILYQSMAYKLRKEKGQHLDRFMSTFLASTNAKYEHTDVGVVPTMNLEQSLEQTDNRGKSSPNDKIFGNNLNLSMEFSHSANSDFLCDQSQRDYVKGASLCIVEAVDGLLDVPPVIARLFWIFACLSRKRLDPLVNVMFDKMLMKLLDAGRAAIVIELLHAKLLDGNCTRDFTSQGRCRDYYETAKEGMYSFLPWWLVGFSKPWNKLIDSLLDPLQNAPFNKHLAYLLLDQLLVNLFPEATARQHTALG